MHPKTRYNNLESHTKMYGTQQKQLYGKQQKQL